MRKRSFKNPAIGIVIALKEEFTILQNNLELYATTVKNIEAKGYILYEYEYITINNTLLNLVILVLNDMGNRHSCIGTHYLLDHYSLNGLVNIGLSGLLSNDFHLCDVIIGSSTYEYDYRGKIENSEKDAFILLNGGQAYQASNSIYNFLSQIDKIHPSLEEEWKNISSQKIKSSISEEMLQELQKEGLLAKEQSIQKGPLASGPFVSSSLNFKEHLKKQNRNYTAIDMESAGFLAAIATQNDTPISLVIRGISDPADSRKKGLDTIKKGVIRKIAMENAVNLLHIFLNCYSFRKKEFPNTPEIKEKLNYIFVNRSQGTFTQEDRINQQIIPQLRYPFNKQRISNKLINSWNNIFSLIGEPRHLTISPKNYIEDIFTYINQSKNNNPLQIYGHPGTGISPFLSLLYQIFYSKYKNNYTTYYPLYIDFRQYQTKIYHNNRDIIEQAKEYINQEIKSYKSILSDYNIKEIILIFDGVDYTSDLQKPLEKEVLKNFENYTQKKIVGIRDYSLTRGEKILHHLTEEASITFSSITVDKSKFTKLVKNYLSETNISIDPKSIVEILKKCNLSEIDLFLLNLIVTQNNNNRQESISHYLKNYCISYLENKSKEKYSRMSFEEVIRFVFEYRINKKKFSEEELYYNPAWFLMNRHKEIQDYLIAEYVLFSLIQIANGNKEINFNFAYPHRINSYCKILINRDIFTQRSVYAGAKIVLEMKDKLYAHANALYLLGRLTDPAVQTEALELLKIYLQKNSPSDIRNLCIKRDNKYLLALRTCYISLTCLGDLKSRDEYLKILLSNDTWCSLNRGFHLIYYGDMDFEPKFDFIVEDNLREFPHTYAHLYRRIKQQDRKPLLEIEIYTFFSLIQHRHNENRYTSPEYREIAIDLIDEILEKEKVEYPDLISYLRILQDILKKPSFSHFSLLRQINQLKFEKRKGWTSRGFKNEIEVVASHTLGTIYMASLLLPEKGDIPGYDKQKIIDMLIFHDLAECQIGDKLPHERNDEVKAKEKSFYERLSLYRTYNFYDIQNAADLWKQFEDERTNINSIIAHEIDLLDAYAELLAYLDKGESISKEDFKKWHTDLRNIHSDYGLKIKKYIEVEYQHILSKYQ